MRRRFTSKNISFEPFYIEALEDGASYSIGIDTKYKIDNGDWVFLQENENSPSINIGSKLYIKSEKRDNVSFNITNGCRIGGDIRSLSYGDKFLTIKGLKYEYQFSRLFYNCASLLEVDENLLKFTELTNGCYYQMFYGCTSLTNAPELPATTLADSCYSGMFGNCTSLVNAPELPATTLVNDCYFNMFYGCTSLTNAPELPATTLADECYGYMFDWCTSLTSAPELPATTLADECYYRMFRGCISLNYIKMLATDISASNCLFEWVRSVSSTGTFVKSKDATWDTTPGALDYNGVPEGWTVITDEEESGGGLINFTMTTNPMAPSINSYKDEVYQAEQGMTWIEWCESEYNINNFSILETPAGFAVIHNYGNPVVDLTGSSVDVNQIIENNGTYYYE